MAQKPETTFRTNTVIPFLKTLKNAKVYPIQQLTINGDLDFHLCCAGLFVVLELKDTNGTLSKLQEYNLADHKRCGGVSIVASPENWAEVRKLLRRLDNGESES